MNIYPENIAVALLTAIVWIVLPLLFFSYKCFLFKNALFDDKIMLILFAVFFMATIISGVLSKGHIKSFSYTIITAVIIFICGGIWPLLKRNMDTALKVYSVLGSSLIFTVAVLQASNFDERLEVIKNPNSLSMIILGIICTALLISNKILRLFIITISIIIVLWTESRSGMLGIIIALCFYFSFKWKGWTPRIKITSISLIGFIALICVVTISDQVMQLTSSLLQLDNPYRGIGTGFTGRYYGWIHAINIWLDNIYFGIGYRLDSLYFNEVYADTALHSYRLSSAHNGYLTLLMEVGLVGFIPAMIIFFKGYKKLYYMASNGILMGQVGFSLISGYLFIMLFERYFINVGNPTSILVLIFILIPYKYYPSKRTGPQRYRPGRVDTRADSPR